MSSSVPTWGSYSFITANKRRRVTAESARGELDDDGDGNRSTVCAVEENIEAGVVEENPFDSIGRFLDERENVAKKIHAVDMEKDSVALSVDQEVIENDTNINSRNQYSPSVVFSPPDHEEWDFDNNSYGGGIMSQRSIPSKEKNDDQHAAINSPVAGDGVPIGILRNGNDSNAGFNSSEYDDEALNNDVSPLPMSPNANDVSQRIVQQQNQTATSTKRKKEYSIMTTTTSRFTFQSTKSAIKSTIKSATKQPPPNNNSMSNFKTPSNESLPHRTLFSTSQTSTAKKRRVQRHSFRQSLDRSKAAFTTTPAAEVSSSDARAFGCTPSFLAKRRGAGGDKSTDDISQEYHEVGGGAVESNRLNTSSFLSTQDGNKRLETNRRSKDNAKSGYLLQRLRSLRNSDQRMAMRLRSGQYSTSFSSAGSSGGSLTARKRRRSGNDYLDPKNVALTELDVTVLGGNIPGCEGMCSFGEGKTIMLSYIHRYEITKEGISMVGSDAIKRPCYSWIVLPNDVLREQGIAGDKKQLRLYDAVVIPPRVTGTMTECMKQAMPTIVCTHVCEQYSKELTALPDVSFEQFAV